MNRDILFRGKRKHNGEWDEGYLVKINNFTFLVTDVSYFYSEINTDVFCYFDVINNLVEVIPETVGQYTGLKDKNVANIFEGDVLGGKYFKGVVKFIGGQWFVIDGNTGFVTLNYAITEDAYIKVIGNIHDK